jgi:hypothetical protein
LRTIFYICLRSSRNNNCKINISKGGAADIEKKRINEISRIIAKDFSNNGIYSLAPKTDFEEMEEFRNYLIGKLTYLLDNKFDLFLNVLYRIDVDEDKVKELFAPDNRDFIPGSLADLIIQRQLQKIIWRERYKNESNE